MYSECMELFLSRENLIQHARYAKDLSLKYSILVKSCPELSGGNIGDIRKLRISNDVKRDAEKLICEIESHRIYFSSFCKDVSCTDYIKKNFSSKESFMYWIYEAAKDADSDFLYLWCFQGRKPLIDFSLSGYKARPVLALDLCEHAYFSDYGFNRDEYLRNAISHLDISKLANS